ncbi:MAG: contractile injection system protein, VgrG/Pvc8 family [Novosphingobium sp.]
MAESFTLPHATWLVMLDGENLTDKINPRLISASITQKREDEADQLDITLHDADGAFDIPRPGKLLKVSMGWERGSGLPLGLVELGTFKVDEAKWGGPPDKITIRARSADFTDAFRIRKERSFVGKTVSAVLGAVAADNGLTPAIDAGLGAKTIPALGPGAKSDAALLRALGKRFDAVATVKNGSLIFTPIGSGKAPGGGALPGETIDREATSSVDYERVERENYGGVVAVWHDKKSGARKQVQAGGSADTESKPKRIRKVFANEADARQHAEAEDTRISRTKARITIDLALGRPDLYPERPITLTGFKPEVDERKWIVAETSHTMDGRGGLKSKLTLEAIS